MVGLTMRRCEHMICNLDLCSHLQNTRNFRAQSGSRARPTMAKQVIDHQKLKVCGSTHVFFLVQLVLSFQNK
jgi:hypothetical protein